MVDETITRQELIDAKRDAHDLGKAVNEKVIVSPRYGDDFKSISLIVEEGEAKITQAAQTITSATASIVAQKNQASAAISEAESDVSMAAASVHQRGNQEIANLQNAIDIAAAAGAGENGWTAQLIVDASGETQQEINILSKVKVRSILDYNPDTTGTTASDAQYAQLLADSNDGDTIYIGYGTYIESNLTISKNVNIEQVGDLLLNGNNNNKIILSQSPTATLTASNLYKIPSAGDGKIEISSGLPADSLANYFFTIESTQIATMRLGFVDPYYKNEIGLFMTSDGFTATPILDDYISDSSLKIVLYKKQRQRFVNNLVPKIKAGTFSGSERLALVEQTGVSNIIFNGCGVDKTNAVSFGRGWVINRSALNTYNNPVGIYCNATGGDAYTFNGFVHGFNVFNMPTIQQAPNAHRGRFMASRHGNFNTFNNLNGLVDGHWDFNGFINNPNLYSEGSITWAGGDLTITNAKKTGQPLVVLRSDTPTAHGKLTITNFDGDTLLYSARSTNDPTVSILRKAWDEIIIENARTHEKYERVIAFRGYNGVNDINDKTKITLKNIEYTRDADASHTDRGFIRGENTGAFNYISELNIDGFKTKVVGVDSVDYVSNMLVNVYTDKIVCKDVEDFSADLCRFDDGLFVGGSVGSAHSNFTNVSTNGEIKYIGTRFNDDTKTYSYASTVSNAIFHIGCVFDNPKPLQSPSNINAIARMTGNTYGSLVSSTLYSVALDVDDYVNPLRVKQLRGKRDFTTDLTVPANSSSLTYTISCVGARVGDAVNAEMTKYVEGVYIDKWVSTDNQVTVQVRNSTSASVTIAQPFAINARVVKL